MCVCVCVFVCARKLLSCNRATLLGSCCVSLRVVWPVKYCNQTSINLFKNIQIPFVYVLILAVIFSSFLQNPHQCSYIRKDSVQVEVLLFETSVLETCKLQLEAVSSSL